MSLKLKKALEQIKNGATSVDLSSSRIGDRGEERLPEALKSDNCKLTSLDLYSNNLTEQGAKHLRQALKSPLCKLTSLNLSWNNLRRAKRATPIKSVKLTSVPADKPEPSVTNLTEQGAKHLQEALSSGNCQLTFLNLTDNKISSDIEKTIAELCTWNGKIQAFDFGDKIQSSKFMETCRMDPAKIVVDYLSDSSYRATNRPNVLNGLHKKVRPIMPLFFIADKVKSKDAKKSQKKSNLNRL